MKQTTMKQSMTTQLIVTDAQGQAQIWLLVSAEGEVLERAEAARAAIADRVVVAVPASDILIRQVDVPGRSDAQDRGAVFLALKEALAASPDTLHVALGPKWPTRQVGVVARARMDGWLAALKAQGITPDSLVPDACLAPQSFADLSVSDDLSLTGRTETIVLALSDRVLINAPDMVTACEPDLLVMMLGDTNAQVVTTPRAVEDTLARGLRQNPLELRQGDYADKTARTGWRRLAVLAVIAAIILPLIGLAGTAWRYHQAAKTAEADTLSTAKAALPEARRLVKPLAQLKEKKQTLMASRRFLEASAVLFTAIEPMEGVSVSRLTYSAEGDLWASLTHPNAADLDRLEAALAIQGAAMTREGSRGDDMGQSSDITIGVQ